MAAHTASAGRVYFPAGAPDPRDVIDGSVDFEGSIRREIAEETGLTYREFVVAPLWHTVIDGPVIGHFKVLSLNQNAQSARERILIHLASDPTPELADIRIARGPADLDEKVPRVTAAFLKSVWR
jgi:8-oxo-dGTP pyrophosphatase MutT (NUDIX family)